MAKLQDPLFVAFFEWAKSESQSKCREPSIPEVIIRGYRFALAAARAQSARSVVQVGLFGELKIGVPWIILEWVGLNILDLF